MPIISTELLLYKAAVSASPSANGGRFTYTQIVDSVGNNIFPDVSQSERTAGSTLRRKVFFRNVNAANLGLVNPRVFMENYTPADDRVLFIVGDMINFESTLTGTEKQYGCAKLNADVSAAATTMQVLLENSVDQFFANGDSIRISDRATLNATGNEEFVTISGTPSLVGSVVSITFTPALQNPYAAAAARVANIYKPSTVIGSVTNFSVTSSSGGNYDNTNDPIVCPNLGGVYDDWTLTFTSSTTYTISGAREGSQGTGSTTSGASPINANTATPYFTILAAGFSGSFTSGDTILFRTLPAAVPVWLKRTVPASTNAYSGNKFTLVIDGETA
jgi:hypothetical protein